MAAELEPIGRSDTLADTAYHRLRSALMSGSFRPGDSLSIRQLAGMLGISATPARDAISRVLWEHGLENGPHRTIIVPVLTQDELRKIYDLREALEGLATSIAATRFGGAELKRLKAAQASHLASVEAHDYRAALAANESFHFAIYEASDNAILIEMIRGLWLKLGPSFNLLYPIYDRSRLGISHHNEIVTAMSSGDPDAARAAIIADLSDGWQELSKALAAAENDALQ